MVTDKAIADGAAVDPVEIEGEGSTIVGVIVAGVAVTDDEKVGAGIVTARAIVEAATVDPTEVSGVGIVTVGTTVAG